ncbi:MAG: hypothetical protein HZB26_17410 [Candidatus Hydrogenedentes bacterium]|nr:hypothetical protein [Candidatus Hydrogenedentota bacterium]
MFNIGPIELIILLAIGLIFLGPEKFPEVVKIVMRAYRDFRGYVTDVKRDLADELNPVKNEIKQLSRFNPEDYIDKLAGAVMKDEPDEKKDPELPPGESATGAGGSVPYQAHDTPKTEEAPGAEAHKEEEYPD